MSELSAENKQIKFPAKSYVGLIGRAHDRDNMPLAFMTEDGTDKAAQKRKATVDSWVGYNSHSHSGEKKIRTLRSYDNIPLVGFRLGRSIRRHSGWGSGNVKWRIEDPRGFELEISSPNMAQIVDACVIQNGEILDECIWARLKGDNVLVPVSSELYKAATRNEERMKAKVSTKDVERGDHVVLHNGQEGVYLGKFESLERNYHYDRDTRSLFEYKWKKKPVHAMILAHSNGISILHTFATFKPSYLTKREGGPLSPEEAETMAWDTQKARGYYSERLYLSQTSMVYEEKETTLDAYMDKSNNGRYLLCDRGDQTYLVNISDWQYADYLKQKSQTPAPAPATPLGFARVHSSWNTGRTNAQITRVSKETNGGYLVHHKSSSASIHIPISELETLPLRTVKASVATHEGKARPLS